MTDHPKVFRHEDGSIDFGRSNSVWVDDSELRVPRMDKRLASGALSHRDQKAQMTPQEYSYRKELSLEKRETRKLARKVDQALQESINDQAEVLSQKALRQLHRLLDKEEPTAAELKVILDSFLGTPTQRVEVSGVESLTPILIQRKATSPAIDGEFQEIEQHDTKEA